jgi:hypothetical protein
MIVDGDVNELPSGALSPAARIALASAMAGDAVADGIEPAELFDVHVDDLAWRLALVAGPCLLGLETGEQAQAASFEDARDAGFGDGELAGDVLLGVALTSQSLNRIGCGARDLAWQ